MAKLRNIFKKHLIPNLESKCRLCLSDRGIVQCIFQPENSKETTDTLVEKIFECTAIMLSKDFDFPSPICEDCALKLDEFLLFRTKCLRSNEIYRFNRLHKHRFLVGSNRVQSNERKPPVDDSGGSEEAQVELTELCPEYGGTPEPQSLLPSLTIAEASSSGSSDNHTVVCTGQSAASKAPALSFQVTQEDGETCTVQDQDRPGAELLGSACNGDLASVPEQPESVNDELSIGWKPLELDESESTDRFSAAPIVLIVGETDTTVSESEEIDELVLPLPEDLCPPPVSDDLLTYFQDIRFPVETVEQLEQLERLVRTSTAARETYITILRQLKTHNTSLGETYQRLFGDGLLIHYNYDGISPKYNKRPLKTLLLFTDCMAAAWEDHMDAAMVKDAVMEAVRKSHNRYNQYNHRKRASYEWL